MAKKKKDKAKKVKKPEIEETGEKPPSEKEILTQKCEDLQRRLEKMTFICENLEQDFDRCRSQYESVVRDKDAISNYLLRTLREELDKCAELQKRMDEIFALHKPRQDELKREMEKAEQDFNAVKDNMIETKLALTGKLSLMEELRLQKDGLMHKLETAEGKVSKEAVIHKKKLRDLDYKILRARDKFHRGCLKEITDASNSFKIGALANLTYVIRSALEERYHAGEQLRKNADIWLELQEENSKLHQREMIRKFEIELDDSHEMHQSLAKQQQQREIEEAQKRCESLRDRISRLDEVANDYETERIQANDLRNEFLRMESQYGELNTEKTEQEKYLKSLQDSVNSLRKNNSRLRTVIMKAEQVFKKEVVSVLEENGVELSCRNDLLRQFVDILKTNTTLMSGGHQRTSGGENFGSSYDSVGRRRRRRRLTKDASTQTINDLVIKYHKKKLFNCHFLQQT